MNVSKDMRSNNRNGCKNQKSAIIITRRLMATKPRLNRPRLATWKSQPIQETIQPLPKLASAKGWGGQLVGSKIICAQAQSASLERKPKRLPYEGI